MRLVDWYLGLDLGQKIVLGVAVTVLVFVFAYLASIIVLLAAGVGREDYPPQQEGGKPAPGAWIRMSFSSPKDRESPLFQLCV